VRSDDADGEGDDEEPMAVEERKRKKKISVRKPAVQFSDGDVYMTDVVRKRRPSTPAHQKATTVAKKVKEVAADKRPKVIQPTHKKIKPAATGGYEMW
jgi:hypothetical protein